MQIFFEDGLVPNFNGLFPNFSLGNIVPGLHSCWFSFLQSYLPMSIKNGYILRENFRSKFYHLKQWYSIENNKKC